MSVRERAFLEELDHSESLKETAKTLTRLKQRSGAIRNNLADLQQQKKCLLYGLQKWTNLSEKAKSHRQGAQLLAKKYPLYLKPEALKLRTFYRRVDSRLQHEKADLESQILANEERLATERARRKECMDEQAAQRRHHALLRNKIENCQELQRHCIFSRTLWVPTPCG